MLCREHREAIADLKQANRKEIRDRMEDADVVHADRIQKLKARIERTRVKSEAAPPVSPPKAAPTPIPSASAPGAMQGMMMQMQQAQMMKTMMQMQSMTAMVPRQQSQSPMDGLAALFGPWAAAMGQRR